MHRQILLVCLFLGIRLACTAQTATSWEDAKDQGQALKKIKIVHEHLQALPDIFNLFPNLEEVDFSNNRIKSLPPSFYTCKKLKVINFFNNQLSVINDSIAAFQDLEYISLNANELVQVSAALFSLPRLTEIHLRHNQIRHLSNYEKTNSALKKLISPLIKSTPCRLQFKMKKNSII